MKHERPASHESNHLKRFEDYLHARKRKSTGRYLQVARQFLEVNADEDDPFEARHVDGFLADLSRGDAKGRTLRWSYYTVKSIYRALGHPWPPDP